MIKCSSCQTHRQRGAAINLHHLDTRKFVCYDKNKCVKRQKNRELRKQGLIK